MIQTARVYCKSKGSQCCTPINLHVCIMQLVWIPSMCRAGCQVVCLLTRVLMYTHANCQQTTECSGMWQRMAALLKVFVCQDPLPQTPHWGCERDGACCPSPPSSPCCDGMIKAAPHEATNLESQTDSPNVFFCLPLTYRLLNLFYRRLCACVDVCLCACVGLIQLFSNPISPKRLFDAICERVALIKTERERESGDQSFADTLLHGYVPLAVRVKFKHSDSAQKLLLKNCIISPHTSHRLLNTAL